MRIMQTIRPGDSVIGAVGRSRSAAHPQELEPSRFALYRWSATDILQQMPLPSRPPIRDARTRHGAKRRPGVQRPERAEGPTGEYR